MSQGVTDWATRVVANGGAMPSGNTIACMETLRLSLISLGLTNKIYSLCIFVPDSIIAATTPLIKNKGSDPWTNNNFVVGDLSINGLTGNGTTKSLDTGVKAKIGEAVNGASGRSCGQTVIVTESDGNDSQSVSGARDAAAGLLEILSVSSNGISKWAMGTTLVDTNDFARVGYVSGNVATNLGTTNVQLFVASPLEAHKLLKTFVAISGSTLSPPVTEDTISVFAHKHAGTNTAWTGQRLSMACVHDGFTQTESSNFWWAVKTCRESLGGGTGDPVHDWARNVTNFGGAAISTTTSNGLRTFYAGLDTDGLLYKMVAVNPYVPDNLTAARTPLIWQGGNQIWTNTAFGETNVTVNGLTGNGTTKYLGSGISAVTLNATTVRGFSSNSAGISLLIYNIPSSTANHDVADQGTAANSLFALQNDSGTLKFYCWKFTTVNTDFIARAAPSPGGTWPGYISGNRTANNAIRLDWVTNGVHNIATNGTGAQTGSTATLTNLYVFCNNSDSGTAVNFADHTMSFLGIHSGLTQTQSSNLWWRVANLRTNLGGGVP